MALKESQKRDRMKIATAGLQYFFRQDRLTLSEIFGNDVASTDAEVAETVTARGRKWQREMMKRLEIDKILRLDPNNTYRLLDENKLGELLAKEDGGMTLARYVFAGYASETNGTALQTVSDIDGADDAEDVVARSDAALADLGGLTALLTAVADEIGNNHKRFNETLGLLRLNSNEQLGLTNKLNEQITQRERSVGKRIDALEERLTDTQRQIQSMQTTLKATLGTLQWLQQRAQDVGEFTEALRVSSEASVHMNAKLDALIVRLDRAESDRTGKVLHELKVHIEESAALRDMLLETVGERDQ
jgi:hypothetical protein